MIRAGVLAGLVFAAAPAAAFDIHVGTGVAVQSFALWHDASGALATLGNPTSVLEYPTLVSPTLTVGVEGDRDGWAIAGEATVFGLGGGAFRDRDYYAGAVLFSDTSSDARQDYGLTGRVTALAPLQYALGERWSATPFLRGQVEVQRITSYGLRCNAVCLGGTRPDDLAVLQQLAYGAGIGGGLRAETALGPDDGIALDVAALLGGFFVDDSHLLRNDLGPTPNILYRNATLSLDAGVTYRKQLTEALALTVNTEAGLDLGVGIATFAPATASASTHPGGFQRLRFGAGLGLTGQF
ncbi:hypothetical protein SAMN06295905_1385 [Devosia lucknowensis]|uniref:Uncharacterized protein n=1 Tax=Devosia lucknowensis TaxID=1096929 RepID=A0A1Y6EXS4_9HYPH|nr:hypothetical protein [Devosia lucknowensis]SMQ66061.1 hypothetical protein SAMN06295905_1385 [Devosia lucknowensis]